MSTPDPMFITASDFQAREARLQAAIAGLYSTFARYAPPRAMDCSPVTPMSDREWDALTRSPMPSLPADALRRYTAKAVTTWGSPDDFRHFLPRILELDAEGDPGYPEHVIPARSAVPVSPPGTTTNRPRSASTLPRKSRMIRVGLTW